MDQPLPRQLNILLVDDNPSKLLSYEAVLSDLGENLVRAGSGREALEVLLKNEIAIVIIDVCMPDLDGFQLAEMIREHPRFKNTSLLFVSAIQFEDVHRIRGYQLGAVDYVPVPIIPDILRAKVKVFADLYRKTRMLEDLNRELEQRVCERTAELESSNSDLQLAIDVARLGSFSWDLESNNVTWSLRHYTLLGYLPGEVEPGLAAMLARIHREDRDAVEAEIIDAAKRQGSYHVVFRVIGTDETVTWCDARGQCHAVAGRASGRMTGVVMDITDHKLAEQRQRLMLQELHHRVKNTLATVQAIASLTRGHYRDVEKYHESLITRFAALSKTHTILLARNWQRIGIRELLGNELDGFIEGTAERRVALHGPSIDLPSDFALTFGLVIHELVTNAAKYGSLSVPQGHLDIRWSVAPVDDKAATLEFDWRESRGPSIQPPSRRGFGSILLEKLFARGSGNQLSIEYAPSGLEIRLSSKLPHYLAAP